VIDVSDENGAGRSLLLEMAFQTQRRIAFVQQALVDGPVRRVTDCAALPQCLMWVNKRAPLLCVTFETGFVAAQKSEAAGFERLLNICAAAFNRDSLVRIVTIAAAHLAFEHRMVVRQLKCGANFQVTLETSFRRFTRIDNRASPTAGFYV